MKKIISFSLYGENPIYTEWLIKNIILAKKYYPEWSIRVYYNKTVPLKIIKKIDKYNLEKIDMTKSALPGMFWRFLPIWEEGVWHVIIRDADARISLREANAVNVWVKSKKRLHIIRDHPGQNFLIVWGLWWFVSMGENLNIENVMKIWLKKRGYEISAKNYYWVDQDFLRVIYYYFKNDCLIHEIFPNLLEKVIFLPDRKNEEVMCMRLTEKENFRFQSDIEMLRKYEKTKKNNISWWIFCLIRNKRLIKEYLKVLIQETYFGKTINMDN